MRPSCIYVAHQKDSWLRLSDRGELGTYAHPDQHLIVVLNFDAKTTTFSFNFVDDNDDELTMTDLTVLISPLPLYPSMNQGFRFGRRSPKPASRIMVTLESEVDPGSSEEADGAQSRHSTPRRSWSPRFDSSLLSPPPHNRTPRRRHRPTRSRSAPPEGGKRERVPETAETPEEEVSSVVVHVPFVQPAKKHIVAFPSGPTTQGGELIRPPPPLREFFKNIECLNRLIYGAVRPTTFWRKTPKSGVTAASFSPASHLIRRSTFIAAGLSFEAPVYDLSAFCVESRVGFIVVQPEQEL